MKPGFVLMIYFLAAALSGSSAFAGDPDLAKMFNCARSITPLVVVNSPRDPHYERGAEVVSIPDPRDTRGWLFYTESGVYKQSFFLLDKDMNAIEVPDPKDPRKSRILMDGKFLTPKQAAKAGLPFGPMDAPSTNYTISIPGRPELVGEYHFNNDVSRMGKADRGVPNYRSLTLYLANTIGIKGGKKVTPSEDNSPETRGYLLNYLKAALGLAGGQYKEELSLKYNSSDKRQQAQDARGISAGYAKTVAACEKVDELHSVVASLRGKLPKDIVAQEEKNSTGRVDSAAP